MSRRKGIKRKPLKVENLEKFIYLQKRNCICMTLLSHVHILCYGLEKYDETWGGQLGAGRGRGMRNIFSNKDSKLYVKFLKITYHIQDFFFEILDFKLLNT